MFKAFFLDRIQTIVRSRNGHTFDEIAETALEEESAIFSKNERYKQGNALGRLVCSNCGKAGHVAAKCYLRDKKEVRVNKVGSENKRGTFKVQGPRKSDIVCYNCGEVGHMAKDCRKPRQTRRGMQPTEAKARDRPPTNDTPCIGSVNTVDGTNGTKTECIKVGTDISNGKELIFLVDSGADISLIKPGNLDKSRKYDPKGRVRVKSVRGSVIETLGTVQVVICEGPLSIPFTFQLVGRQVDIPCDGILGRDFLTHAGARICYESGTVTFGKGRDKIHKLMMPADAEGQKKAIRRLVLPSRTEIVVRLPVEGRSRDGEGITEKREIQAGVYLAGAATQITRGYAITSVLNTTSDRVEIEEPVLQVTELEPGTLGGLPKGDDAATPVDRSREVLKHLRFDHLNEEERKQIEKTCSVYHDIFHLPGEVMSSTTSVKHEIRLEPGTQPINSRPYRLPESQRQEVGRQVEELREKGIITESNSPWNSPLLVVPKKADASGEKQWRLVIDYSKLNEKTVGDAYPLPDITEILDQLGQSKYFSCIDMVMGYHQIEMADADSALTAFSTKEGHWQYKRLPFGLKTAPATFQRMMNVVLSGLTGSRCFVFLDDVVVYAKSLAEHDDKLRQVFHRIREHNLKLKPEKCEFLRKEVNYQGHVISEDGVLPEPRLR